MRVCAPKRTKTDQTKWFSVWENFFLLPKKRTERGETRTQDLLFPGVVSSHSSQTLWRRQRREWSVSVQHHAHTHYTTSCVFIKENTYAHTYTRQKHTSVHRKRFHRCCYDHCFVCRFVLTNQLSHMQLQCSYIHWFTLENTLDAWQQVWAVSLIESVLQHHNIIHLFIKLITEETIKQLLFFINLTLTTCHLWWMLDMIKIPNV